MEAKPISILVVDDDFVTRFLHKTLIESLGLNFTYTEAVNGKAALDLLLMNNMSIPDIILLDINMPIMDGFEFAEAFKQLQGSERTRIVMVSSSQNPADINHSERLGIKKFLSKPLNAKSLGMSELFEAA